jgi:hypothetical protein
MTEIVESINKELTEQYEIRDAANNRIAQLEKAKSFVQGTNHRTYDPEKAAGKQNIADVATYLQARGSARQVEITNDLDKNSGTVSCAMQVLEKKGWAKEGERINRSVEWHWTGPTQKHKIKSEILETVA